VLARGWFARVDDVEARFRANSLHFPLKGVPQHDAAVMERSGAAAQIRAEKLALRNGLRE
jgi:hypothetical protein